MCSAADVRTSLPQVPALRDLFVVTPLNWQEWKGVLLFSAPVIVIDEVCKWVTRNFVNPPDAPGLLPSQSSGMKKAANGVVSSDKKSR